MYCSAYKHLGNNLTTMTFFVRVANNFFLNYMCSSSLVAPHVEEDWESEYQQVMSNGLENTPYGKSAFKTVKSWFRTAQT